ncbi:MAG: site-specific integrase, partial [Xanthobacteraceae bacterium]
DPFTELTSRRSTGRTFGAVATDYIQSMQAGWRNEKHQAQWRMTLLGEIGKLDKDGKPIKAAIDYCAALRKRPVADINTDDVLKVLKPIWTAKAETARRIRGRIERVLDAAKAAGERAGENPARLRGHLDLMLPKSERLQRGHHAAMPYAEIPAFLAKIRAAGGTASRALKFLILTAARSGEVRGATWDEIQDDLWVIPASRMKAQREHRVPLTEAAQAILDQLRSKSTSRLIFPGWKTNVPLSDMSLTAVMRRHGAGQYTAHGFRSAFRDWCGDCTSYPREVAEAALAHAVGDAVERAYRRGDALEKRRALMQDWTNYCAGGADGTAAKGV